jgi:hypothetical protein
VDANTVGAGHFNILMNILKKELKYLLFALKKFWIFWLIPALLSIYMYIIAEVTVEDIDLAKKLFSVFSVSYDILEIVLNIFWPVTFIVTVLYICGLHFKIKIRKKTVFFLVLSLFIFLILMDLLGTLLLHNSLYRYTEYTVKISELIAFIFSVSLFPFCVFKIKDIIKINIIFIKKYFMIFVLLLVSNMVLDKIINKISNLSFIESISMYTFSNLVKNMSFFLLVLTVISFKKRKLIQANLLKLLEKVKNRLHK